MARCVSYSALWSPTTARRISCMEIILVNALHGRRPAVLLAEERLAEVVDRLGFGVESVEFSGSGCLVPVVGEGGELVGGAGGEGVEGVVCGLVFGGGGDLGGGGGEGGGGGLGLG